MTTYLGKSCSFCLPRVPFVNCRQFMYYFPFGFEGRIWDLIVSVPDHFLSFYFVSTIKGMLLQRKENIAMIFMTVLSALCICKFHKDLTETKWAPTTRSNLGCSSLMLLLLC